MVTEKDAAMAVVRKWESTRRGLRHLPVDEREALAELIAEALSNERERAAGIAETHSATNCDGPDCGVVIAAAIRNQDDQG